MIQRLFFMDLELDSIISTACSPWTSQVHLFSLQNVEHMASGTLEFSCLTDIILLLALTNNCVKNIAYRP